MEIYEFNKCLLDRVEECMNVLSWQDQPIPPSQVRHEWAYYIEVQIEPVGWQALWKIPRVICNELKLHYPTVVFGHVEEVLFKELKAIFVVDAVQDDLQMPERHEVALEDLFPTIEQENNALNVECTADCLDRLRFFYTHIWMPWDCDNDEDQNWVEKHLKSRIKLCYDLRNHNIKRPLASHIRQLLMEARFLKQRRDYLELDLSDTEEDTPNDSFSKDNSQITELMRLHLRLAMIRSEMEMLENPELRRVFEEIKYTKDKTINRNNNGNMSAAYIVLHGNTLTKQLEAIKDVQNKISSDMLVHMFPTLQDVLSACLSSDSIFLGSGVHTVKFWEYLNGNGKIIGLTKEVILTSPDEDHMLLAFDGDFILENLIIDCTQVQTGIVVKKGHLQLRDCQIVNHAKRGIEYAIKCANGAKISLDKCKIKNFATGVVLVDDTTLTLKHSKFINCDIGISVLGKNAKLEYIGTQNLIENSIKSGIHINSLELNTNVKVLKLEKIEEIKNHVNSLTPIWSGECNFINCCYNIYIVNRNNLMVNENSLKLMLESDADDEALDDVKEEKQTKNEVNQLQTRNLDIEN